MANAKICKMECSHKLPNLSFVISNVYILVVEISLVTKITTDVMNVMRVFLVTKEKNFHSNANKEL